MAQSNLAYDLERFEDHQSAAEVAAKPNITLRQARSIHPAKVVMLALLAILMGFSLLYGRVMITELNESINAVSNDLNILHAEQVRMQTELDGKMSLKAIEEKAIRECGMVKPDGSQVQYVQLTKESKLEMQAKEQGLLEKFMLAIRGLL